MRAILASLAVLMLGGCAAILGIEDVPGAGECVPLEDECDDDETCDVTLEGTECRSVGAGGPGALCDDSSQCTFDTSCVDGLCRSFCDDMDDCASNELECNKQWYGQTVCDSDCDVLAGTGCPNDEVQDCMIALNDFGQPIALCIPDNWYGVVAPGAECTWLSACGEQYGCYDANGDDVGICVPLCTVGTQCPDTSDCVAVFDTLHGIAVGLCPQ
jgi:hypothetical protein